jgi:hypothetical protein
MIYDLDVDLDLDLELDLDNVPSPLRETNQQLSPSAPNHQIQTTKYKWQMTMVL